MTHFSNWIKKLKGHGKEYDEFLQKLIGQEFYKLNESVSIKKISEETEYKRIQVTKWTRQLHDDIFILNSESPELFERDEIKHNLYFRYFDTYAAVTLWLKHTPRVYDCFDFFFVKAKVGTGNFRVRDVTHEIDNGNYQINIQLIGGLPNRYREMLIEKAVFFNIINSWDI